MPRVVVEPLADFNVLAAHGRSHGDIAVLATVDGANGVAEAGILGHGAYVVPAGIGRVPNLPYRPVVSVVVKDAVPARGPEQYGRQPRTGCHRRRVARDDVVPLAQPVARVGIALEV